MGEYLNFICGAIAGCTTSCLVQPLDVVKTNVITLSRPLTILNSVNVVYKQYGLKGFWRGLRPSAYKSFLGSGISFYWLEYFKRTFQRSESKASQFLNDSAVAILSRTITSLTLSPLSVIKVRMEAPQTNPYKNVVDGMIHIYKEEGIKGYYKGIGPALLRDLPFSALAYSFYNQFHHLLEELFGYHKYIPMLSGGLAGFSATLITQPFEIIKTRNQFAHIGGIEAHKYNNIIHAFKTIYATEGVYGFTNALNIRIVERSIAFATVWYIYENLRNYTRSE